RKCDENKRPPAPGLHPQQIDFKPFVSVIKFLFGKIYLSEANQIKNPNGISTVDAKKKERGRNLFPKMKFCL
ncbi:MAG: hypothetical protein IK033_03390, partial [Verrucomicrobia bacterium]|nr:hypothetical protein [Verrucomicrobiota bacterium]